MSLYKQVRDPADVNNDQPFYCTGPIEGERVRCRHKPGGLRLTEGPVDELTDGTVVSHWHYDGCIFDVTLDGGREKPVSFFDGLGDIVLRQGPTPDWVAEVELIAARNGGQASGG